ncbi:MAG: fumarylacetoacetase, partial [Gammaproteobacteria bacterium]
MNAIDATHDPALGSWVGSANTPAGDFPLQNLPFCAFRRARSAEGFRGGVAIGDQVLDLGALHGLGLFDGLAARALAACAEPALNTFMGLGAQARGALRAALSGALRTDSALAERLRPRLIPQQAVEYRVAADVGDY